MFQRRKPTPVARYVPSDDSSSYESEEHSFPASRPEVKKFEPIINAQSLRSRAPKTNPGIKVDSDSHFVEKESPTDRMPQPAARTIKKPYRRIPPA